MPRFVLISTGQNEGDSHGTRSQGCAFYRGGGDSVTNLLEAWAVLRTCVRGILTRALRSPLSVRVLLRQASPFVSLLFWALLRANRPSASLSAQIQLHT